MLSDVAGIWLDLLTFDLHRFRFGQIWRGFVRRLPERDRLIGRAWTWFSGRMGPSLAGFGPNWPQVGQCLGTQRTWTMPIHVFLGKTGQKFLGEASRLRNQEPRSMRIRALAATRAKRQTLERIRRDKCINKRRRNAGIAPPPRAVFL